MEFKESPNTRARQEAIQTCVAFANRDGGKIFFGVADDRTVKGVDVSGTTVEKLVDEIRDHTYPSLMPPVDEVVVDGSRLLIIDVAPYVPPVVGVYLYSGKLIANDQREDAAELQALVRVGKTNQKEDFMRLRQAQPSDPKVRIRVARSNTGYYSNNESLSYFEGWVWTEEGSATAHAIRLYLNPGLFVSEEMVEDLPHPHREGFESVERLDIMSVPATKLLEATEISSVYLDDWGINWKVSRGIRVMGHEDERRRWIGVEDRGVFTRRIVAFPPKRE